MKRFWLVFVLSAALVACGGGSAPIAPPAPPEEAGAEGAVSVEDAPPSVLKAEAPMSASGVELMKEVAPGRTWVIRADSCRAAKAGLKAGTLELEAPRVTGMSDGAGFATLAAESGFYEEGAVSCTGGATLEMNDWTVSAPELRWSGADDRVDASGPTTLSYGCLLYTSDAADE